MRREGGDDRRGGGEAAATVLRAPRSSHLPTAGTHTRPATTPTVMAAPVTGADSLSTVTP
ncbi:hypothetical protein SSTG_05799 [Streptomyces sp. e14]|nr:hypothetical protein SSTG_05799 [Streptomyces sp. e14]